MSESIRAIIVILILGPVAFSFLAKPYSLIFSSSAFTHIRNSWLILTVIAFISPNFWFFIAIATVFLLAYLPKTPEQRVVYYLLLLCVLPNISATIPGFGGIRFIFDLSYNRFLILLLLIPVLMNNSQRNPHQFRLFNVKSDLLIILFVSIQALLFFRDNTITNALRESLMLLVDVFVPYYVISRHVNTQEQFNLVLAAILITISILAFFGIFEAVKHWLLYSPLRATLIGRGGGYDVRAGNLRAVTVFSSPIVFGYVLTIGFGLLLYLRPLLKWNYLFYLNAAVIVLAELATVSRGPWLGFVVLILAYIWTDRKRFKIYAQGILAVAITIPVLSMTPFWDKFVQLLPFIGTVRSDTIDYRERLFEMAWIVFKRNPLLGSSTYRATPEMESMRQGQGIIDVVNSYIHIGLKNGLVGLTLFLLIFTGLILNINILLHKIPSENVDLIRLGRSLFAILVAIMFTIITVSSINYIPVFYWIFSGLAAGYIFMARKVIHSTESTTK